MGWKDAVIPVHVTADGQAPMRAAGEVRASARRGLEGERYHDGKGYYSDHSGTIRLGDTVGAAPPGEEA